MEQRVVSVSLLLSISLLLYQLSPCVDIDECATLKPCTKRAQCINYDGSYECVCPKGFFGNGRICKGERDMYASGE